LPSGSDAFADVRPSKWRDRFCTRSQQTFPFFHQKPFVLAFASLTENCDPNAYFGERMKGGETDVSHPKAFRVTKLILLNPHLFKIYTKSDWFWVRNRSIGSRRLALEIIRLTRRRSNQSQID
jgi:hypothetical protein